MNTLVSSKAFGRKINPITDHWVKQLNEYCLDLKKDAISIQEWRSLIAQLYQRVELEELLEFINFEHLVKGFQYPDLGVHTKPVRFPKLKGLPARTAFIKKDIRDEKGTSDYSTRTFQYGFGALNFKRGDASEAL